MASSKRYAAASVASHYLHFLHQVDCRRSSPYCAALIHGASSHVVEQDDVHKDSVFHLAAR
ncbi:hypothetical protein D3C81_2257400 [compost metagenome]